MKNVDFNYVMLGAAVGFFFAAVAVAQTTDQIWRNIYDSANTAIRINVVAS